MAEPKKKGPIKPHVRPPEVSAANRPKAGPFAYVQEEEEQRWSNPEDRDDWCMRWVLVPPDDKRCVKVIDSNNSPWKGNRCRGWALHGTTVCMAHGGRLPNVRKAAQRRLALAAPLAADRLVYIALVKPGVSDADRLKALLAILDRSGVEGKTTVELEIKPWQEAIRGLLDGNKNVALPAGVADDDEDDNTIEGTWQPSDVDLRDEGRE